MVFFALAMGTRLGGRLKWQRGYAWRAVIVKKSGGLALETLAALPPDSQPGRAASSSPQKFVCEVEDFEDGRRGRRPQEGTPSRDSKAQRSGPEEDR